MPSRSYLTRADDLHETVENHPSTTVPIRVLILEDRPEDAELMAAELRRSQYEPQWDRVDTEAGYLSGLVSKPDVILSDYSMPLLDARRALELLREFDMDVPFIVVSGAIGEDVAVAMMRHGATDYLLKDRMARLGPAVRRALEEKRFRDETRRAKELLWASEARFYSFMNNSPAFAFIKDEQGRILYMNNTCERLWNTSFSECEGRLDRDLWPADVAATLRAHDLAVLKSRSTYQVIEEVRLKNGNSLSMLLFRFPFSDVAGRLLLGAVGIDISAQIQAQSELSSALAAKEVLLKEVHHRVKNNLQVISSLLMMQAESLSDGPLWRALEASQKRVQSMALIHDRLNKDDEGDSVDFGEYAASLAMDLFCAFGVDPKRVRLRVELEAVSLDLNQATPCGLILNELLTNSLKYGFPDNRCGEVLIRLKCDEKNQCMLTVADDGVGLPPAFDWTQSESLGLRIVRILARQLGGHMEHYSGPGSAFALTFPLNTTEHMSARSRLAQVGS